MNQRFFNVFTIGDTKEVTKARGGLSIIPDLETLFPDIEVKRNLSWVDEGRVVTAAGISAGIDMSLYLVSRLADSKLALDTARQMEYNWKQNP